ncbi:hypothetical protein SAMN04487866_11722 [Thermoactinomyces sp. DSM 45891]|uniref:hypothetical protein n=1 Tax=Thermoactinomyces sp. DSM 45891 TaxID=1761907 RepID=UPI000910CACF|nr:hypothetical protein [Thermoactinomyces sp. DSM 45891]SFX67810.1 hypothetical protein SAMN04487866_11722 [Thermoactinomyces sp. DSM 45891]
MSQFTIFVEYRVQEDSMSIFRDQYFSQIREQIKNQVEHVVHHEFLLSEAQVGQVVEVIQVEDKDAIILLQELRIGSKSSWFHSLDSHIVGGRSKIKLWTFRRCD